ncbi:MAG: DUF4198 domain-containing protein [Pyrinomonadaceae bacterium]
MKHSVFALPALLLLCSAALAHDYWLGPEPYFLPARGGMALVRLHVGDKFKSEEERPLQKERTPRFQLYSRGETLDLLAQGREGGKPVARMTLTKAGNYLVAMERIPTEIKLEAQKFTAYLREEGLVGIVAERERAGESGREGRERYSRHLKTLLQVGTTQDDTYRRNLGHKLEIIPQANPYGMRRGDGLSVQVLFEGKPLPNAVVFVHNRRAGRVSTQRATTDAFGRATFTLDRRGEWLVRLVHMRRCQSADCGEIEWESFWSSYSFGMR